MPQPPKRVVTDILDFTGPVAFDQKTDEHGLHYTAVCPWCAQDIGTGIRAATYWYLYNQLFEYQYEHMKVCSGANLTDMQVTVK